MRTPLHAIGLHLEIARSDGRRRTRVGGKKYRLNETAYIVESDRKQRASGHIVNGCRLAIQPIAYSKNMPCVLRLLEHQRNEVDQFAQSNV